MVFQRVPLTTVRCSSNPTVVLHLLAPSQPESQLRSTKPEPIVTCGCTGKLPGMKYSSVSLSLGEAFRKMSWRFSMHPGHPLVSPGCPSTVLHPVVNLKSILSLKSWGCHHLDSHISHMNHSTNPVYEHSKINYIVPGIGNKGEGFILPHDTTQEHNLTKFSYCMHGGEV